MSFHSCLPGTGVIEARVSCGRGQTVHTGKQASEPMLFSCAPAAANTNGPAWIHSDDYKTRNLIEYIGYLVFMRLSEVQGHRISLVHSRDVHTGDCCICITVTNR